MELVCPAGNVEKLFYAYMYGADTAYIGLKKFSLRVKADNFYEDEYRRVVELKNQFPGKKLFCALNIAFHNRDIDLFLRDIDYFRMYPIDAFIVQDLGIVPILQREFPGAHLHLSTQASCVNREAVRMYRDMGFSRVVLGREATLSEIREIKDANPDVELECFAHGAMCIAYSGRCLMSAYLTGRSAQSGFCSQTCRWNFDVGSALSDPKIRKLNESGGKIDSETAKKIAGSGILTLEEHERRGEKFPVFEGEDFTAVLSSKDLRMAEHLKDMRDAGVDAIKVEGRMKSVYYVAMVARAYRKALDALDGKIPEEEARPFVDALSEVPQRECTTGFYYGRAEADRTTVGASDSPYILAATVGAELDAATVLAAGARKVAEREETLAAMHPEARSAALRDEERHPEKRLRAMESKIGWNLYSLDALNKIDFGTEIEIVSPDVLSEKIPSTEYEFVNPKTGLLLGWVNADHDCALYTAKRLEEGVLVRMRDPDFVQGKIRDAGR